MNTLAFQRELRPEIPNVYGTQDYHAFRETLIKIDEVLVKSGLEHDLVSRALTQQAEADNKSLGDLSGKQYNYQYSRLKHALRCNIARHLTGEFYRAFSLRLADSTLFQWFASISAFGVRKAVSKSTLERYEKQFDESLVSSSIREWLSILSDKNKAADAGLAFPVSMKETYMDSTCIKAHIHFPVDWLLLRDAARSLLLAINTIRKQGLKHRMIEPSVLLREMNKLCIRMTHARRKKDSKKQRKKILREMKQLSNRIAKHAKRYRELLRTDWTKTTWSQVQMEQVVCRIDNILDQLRAVIKLAHDRLIGERMIKSSDKLLSLYDKDAQVIVRGQSGSEVEFGQRLLLAEQTDGVIIDWELFANDAPSDGQLLKPVIERMESYYGLIGSTSTDRAFSSAANDEFLKTKNIYNATCPRNPKQLQEQLTDLMFAKLQKRRSQTEARIGIFKNVFLGKPLRSRVTLYKRHAINWCVLTHNLVLFFRKAIGD